MSFVRRMFTKWLSLLYQQCGACGAVLVHISIVENCSGVIVHVDNISRRAIMNFSLSLLYQRCGACGAVLVHISIV